MVVRIHGGKFSIFALQVDYYPLFFYSNPMKKLIIFISVTLFSWIGWWLGARFGQMTGYFLSFIGSLVGVYAGVLFNRQYIP